MALLQPSRRPNGPTIECSKDCPCSTLVVRTIVLVANFNIFFLTYIRFNNNKTIIFFLVTIIYIDNPSIDMMVIRKKIVVILVLNLICMRKQNQAAH